MNWRLRLLFSVLVLIFFLLQYRLWVGDGSLAEVAHLERQIQNKEDDLQKMRDRNQALQAEVEDLKHGLEAVEGRARSQLGMIKQGETFYQIVAPEPKESP